ncbi:hypothetical protein K492DRAFT_32458 [Lichtheimia hyalospora FSU 10163]|nr:hypothetical protein K492DRAFT_32458 [Lichtheimia hyalospora FSU 10163]
MIKCICDTPNEGFGAMVQCDDCRRWLHLECLKMTDEFDHQENFACPQCFVSNDKLGGGQQRRVSSSITWRYAARRESERMAAAMDLEMTSDEEEDEKDHSNSCDDDDDDTDFGTSEASTPEQSYYVAQDGASRMDYFAPHASDVFLCESSYVFVLLKMLILLIHSHIVLQDSWTYLHFPDNDHYRCFAFVSMHTRFARILL